MINISMNGWMGKKAKVQEEKKMILKMLCLSCIHFRFFLKAEFSGPPLRLQINVKKIPSWVTRWRDCKVCWICMPPMHVLFCTEWNDPTNESRSFIWSSKLSDFLHHFYELTWDLKKERKQLKIFLYQI